MDGTYRFALTISGGLAMGAYEAGVLSQLYRDFCTINRETDSVRLVIDVISGASAGSVTGLVLAQALALDRRPDDLEKDMRAIWIGGTDFLKLIKPADGPEQAVFTQAEIDTVSDATILANARAAGGVRGGSSVAVWMALTNLDGIPGKVSFGPLDVITYSYRDADCYLIRGSEIMKVAPTPTGPSAPSTWEEATASAIASASFPVAFKTKTMTRELSWYPAYGNLAPCLTMAQPLPPQLPCQIVDGGIFGNEPVGKAVNAVERLHRCDGGRNKQDYTFIIIEPNPTSPKDVEARLVEIMNRDRAAIQNGMPPWWAVFQMISAYFNDALYSDFVNAHTVNQQLAAIEGLPLTAQEKALVLEAVGLAGKEKITLERVPHTMPTGNRLAGDFFGDFGGFLKQEFREFDFAVGRVEAREWLINWLHANGQATAPVITALGDAPERPQADLSNSGWCRNMTDDERQKILEAGCDRMETLIERWLGLHGLGAAAFDLFWREIRNIVRGRFSRCN